MSRRARNLIGLLLLVLIVAGATVWALGWRQGPPPQPVEMHGAHSKLELHEVATIVASRYRGRMLRAAYVPPTPAEREMGVRAALSIRWITPDRAVLSIRLDARTGRFLDVAGAGQIKARIAPNR
ncbi:hypothetical protein [Paracoccus pacificus]|uniref:Uncharacterized protein n=1 Tax=Paracoccus pacificus TaxID=1463598 RepID=A0ABW4R936_9RHOB